MWATRASRTDAPVATWTTRSADRTRRRESPHPLPAARRGAIAQGRDRPAPALHSMHLALTSDLPSTPNAGGLRPHAARQSAAADRLDSAVDRSRARAVSGRADAVRRSHGFSDVEYCDIDEEPDRRAVGAPRPRTTSSTCRAATRSRSGAAFSARAVGAVAAVPGRRPADRRRQRRLDAGHAERVARSGC